MIDVRRGEWPRALLAFVILLLVLGAYTAVKAVRDAIFLSRFGVREISFVAIGLAFVSGVVVTLFLRFTRGIARHWLITITHGVVAVTLLGLWIALGDGVDGPGWVPWALYIWSSLFGVFIVMQFWLLAADLFDVREAKRLFGLVGAGAIIGALGGGLVAQFVATRWSASFLLAIAAAMLVLAAVLTHVAWPLRPAATEEVTETEETDGPGPSIWQLLREPSLLRLIALALLLSTVATTLIDWQVKAIAKHAFASDANAMASFFGALFTWQSAAALAVQVLLTGWILKNLGLGFGRVVLPIAAVIGSLAILLAPALSISVVTAAGFAKVSEGGLRFAVDKATTELTWLPVPAATRSQTKSFIDTVFDRLGTGLTGVTWLGLALFGFDRPDRIHWMSVVVLGLVALWLLVLRAIHKSYVDAFRSSLASRAIDLASLRTALGDAEAERTLREALANEDADQVLFGLYLLSDGDGPLPDMTPALEHAAPEVRKTALELLSARGELGYDVQAEALLDDDTHDVSEAAIVYLRGAGGEARRDRTSSAAPSALPHDMPFSQAVVALANADRSEAATQHIQLRLSDDAENLRSHIQLLGAAPPASAATLLRPLIDDEDDEIRAAAIRAAGRAGAIALVPSLADRLSDRHWRAAATSALSDMGVEATMALVGQLDRPEMPLPAKMAIVRLAGASGHAPVAVRLAPLLHGEPDLRRAAARALSRLRAAAGDAVKVDAGTVVDELETAAKTLLSHLRFLDRGSWPLARKRVRDETLLERSVRESTDSVLRHIFWLLSLFHVPSDIRSAWRGVSSPLKTVRARSLEFLDNLLESRHRELLIPALEDLDAQRVAAAARSLGAGSKSRIEAIRAMLSGEDRWLAMAACWSVGEQGMTELEAEVAQLASGENALARVAADALHQLGHDRKPRPVDVSETLSEVEKALKLRAVDVLKQAAGEDLAYVAQIATEETFDAGHTLYVEDDAPDALYVVIEGEVSLAQGEIDLGVAESGEAFGSWALVDDSPRVASAKARSDVRVLKVGRDDFTDLLADRPDIVQAVFKAMVTRIRSLAALAQADADDDG